MKHVISHIQNPKPNHEYRNRPGFDSIIEWVAGNPSDVGCVADEKHSYGNENSSSGDEGAATPEPGCAAVAVVTNQRLHNHAGDGTAEPDKSSPLVGNAEKLNVGRQQRQLQRPSELNPGGDGGHNHRFPYGGGRRRGLVVLNSEYRNRLGYLHGGFFFLLLLLFCWAIMDAPSTTKSKSIRIFSPLFVLSVRKKERKKNEGGSM